MHRPPPRNFRHQLALAIAALAVLVSAAVAPAATAQCRFECGRSVTAVDATPACCAAHDGKAPARGPANEHENRDAGHCPVACQACAARPMVVATDIAHLHDLPPLNIVTAGPAVPAGSLDVPFSIFHPPRA